MRAKKRLVVAEQTANLEGAAQKLQAAFRGRQARCVPPGTSPLALRRALLPRPSAPVPPL